MRVAGVPLRQGSLENKNKTRWPARANHLTHIIGGINVDANINRLALHAGNVVAMGCDSRHAVEGIEKLDVSDGCVVALSNMGADSRGEHGKATCEQAEGDMRILINEFCRWTDFCVRL